MDIIDPTGQHKGLCACCLDRFQTKGLRARLAVDDRGTAGGMVQYLPIEHSGVDGHGLCFVLCTWVRGRPLLAQPSYAHLSSQEEPGDAKHSACGRGRGNMNPFRVQLHP